MLTVRVPDTVRVATAYTLAILNQAVEQAQPSVSIEWTIPLRLLRFATVAIAVNNAVGSYLMPVMGENAPYSGDTDTLVRRSKESLAPSFTPLLPGLLP